jgi:hypothetical protein
MTHYGQKDQVWDCHQGHDMWGCNLDLMYNLLLLHLDDLYSSPIEGLPKKVRTKVKKLTVGHDTYRRTVNSQYNGT